MLKIIAFSGGFMEFKAVFFDLDGTLVNSLIDLSVSVNYVLEKNGLPTHPVSAYKYFAGDGIAKMIERAMPEDKRTPDNIDTLKSEFMLHYSVHYADNTIAYDGITELVDYLKKQGYKLAVVTNKAQEMAEKVVLKAFGNSFDYILGLREGLPAKPDPTGIFMAMKELNVSPKDCAFVGDTGMDVAAGVNSGAFPIGVLWGFREKSELEKFGAKAFAENANELKRLIVGVK